MTTSTLPADIEAEEGRVLSAYPDPFSALGRSCTAHAVSLKNYRDLVGWHGLSGSPWTIGCGCTGPQIGPDTVWTDAQATDELNTRIGTICDQLDKLLPWWRDLSDERQDVLIQMAFQLGVSGLLQFKITLANVRSGNFDAAATGMLQSAWAKQTPNRAGRLAEQMKSGIRQEH
jgi:lysozyme